MIIIAVFLSSGISEIGHVHAVKIARKSDLFTSRLDELFSNIRARRYHVNDSGERKLEKQHTTLGQVDVANKVTPLNEIGIFKHKFCDIS